MGQRLGQHFLTSQTVIKDSLDAGDLCPGDTVIEVGPGKGVLTKALLERGAKVIAIEFDGELVEYLEERFTKEIQSGQLTLLHSDALEVRPEDLTKEAYKVIANIPYYITGALLRHFLTSDHKPSKAVLLMQKEVAKRIVARDNKESLLSLSVKAYGKPRIVRSVSRKLFSPPPKVDSAVLLVEHVSKDFFTDIEENGFFELIRLGFSSKRKQLVNNLSKKWPKSVVLECFDFLMISPDIRAEDISLGEWKSILIQLQTKREET